MSEIRTDHDLLVTISERLDNLVNRFDRHLEWLEKQTVKHEQLHADVTARLSYLEGWRWRWVGAMAVGSILLTLLGNIMVKAVAAHQGDSHVGLHSRAR